MVKLVLSYELKENNQTGVLDRYHYSLRHVKRIAECSPGAFRSTFDLQEATICLLDLHFVYFLEVF